MITKKTIKFITSKTFYLALGIFLVAGLVAYAAWDGARTGGSGELTEANWNALVNDFHTKCGSACDVGHTNAQAIGGQFTKPNWNGLIDMMSQFENSLDAGNIKAGEIVFGVVGTYGAAPACDGYLIDDKCWYAGSAGQSCNAVCSAHGGSAGCNLDIGCSVCIHFFSPGDAICYIDEYFTMPALRGNTYTCGNPSGCGA